MVYAPRGFHFDLKAALSKENDATPRIDLKIPVYEESSENFLRAVSSYKNKAITAITAKREKDQAELKRIQEKAQKFEEETNRCKVQEIELMASLEREQTERKDAEIAVAAFKRQIASLHERSTTMQAQIDEYRATVASLKTDKGKERAILNKYASRVAPEIRAYEELLACSIEGLEKDQLLITFRCVDISDMDKEFSFILDVATPLYKVIKTSPSVPSLPLLVEKLNMTRDIYAFIVKIRQEFHKLANGEDINQIY